MNLEPATNPLTLAGLPMATPIAFDPSSSTRRTTIDYHASRAEVLLATSRVEPQPGTIDPGRVGRPGSVVDMSGLPVGDATTPTALPATTMIRSVHSDQSPWGGSAGHYLSLGEFGMHDLPAARRRERDLVAGTPRGTLVLMTNSGHSSQGAGLVGLARFAGAATEGDVVGVYGETVLQFEKPLASKKHLRPVGLRGAQSGFGTTFSGVPVLTPCTATDVLSVGRVLGLPQEVLFAPQGDQPAALQDWARSADLDAIARRWHHEALYKTAPDPRRVLLGGAAQMIGRVGELVVADLLEAASASTAVVDVTAIPDLGHDLEVRPLRFADRFDVEVKATCETLSNPVSWARQSDRLTPTQRQSARSSLQRGEVPWYCAVVSSALSATPTVTFISAIDILTDGQGL